MEIRVARPLAYTRIYSDSEGESHFEDEELTFTLVDFAPPAPPISVSNIHKSKEVFIISSQTGWFGDWHPAPQRQFIFILIGELEVQVSDGDVKTLGPGSFALLEDTFGKGHVSRVVSTERCYCAVVPLAEG